MDTGGTTPGTCRIILPDNITIKPSGLTVKYSHAGDIKKIQGYNPITSTWEDIVNLSTSSTEETTEKHTITVNTYYSMFRIYANSITGTVNYTVDIYEFWIWSGTIKKQLEKVIIN